MPTEEFNRSELVPLDEIPWTRVKQVVKVARLAIWSVEWPDDKPSVITHTTPDALEAFLRDEHNFEGAPYSYHYEGEVVNLRKPWGTDSAGRPLELHIRARRNPDGTGLETNGHIEYSRYEEKERHLNDDHIDFESGTAVLEGILNT